MQGRLRAGQSRDDPCRAGDSDPEGCTIKAAPKEAVPYIYLSQLYAKDLKKPEVGLKYAEQALALAPDNFAAYLAVYEIDIAMGQTKKAELLLDRAAKSEHGDAKYWTQLGDLSTRLYLKEDGSADAAQLQKMNAIYRKAAELGRTTRPRSGQGGRLLRGAQPKQVKDAIPYLPGRTCARSSGRPERSAPLRQCARQAGPEFSPVTEQTSDEAW